MKFSKITQLLYEEPKNCLKKSLFDHWGVAPPLPLEVSPLFEKYSWVFNRRGVTNTKGWNFLYNLISRWFIEHRGVGLY